MSHIELIKRSANGSYSTALGSCYLLASVTALILNEPLKHSLLSFRYEMTNKSI